MISKINLYFYTLKYLRREQFIYRLKYFLRSKIRKLTHFRYSFDLKAPQSIELVLIKSIPSTTSCLENKTFCFLNLTKTFTQNIDWDFDEYGKLWTYNLNYFEFLNQTKEKQQNLYIDLTDTEKRDFKFIFDDFIQKLPSLKNALEPFPISLRVINWIKYFSAYKIKKTKYDQFLYAQLKILADNLEYHLLGNHLLENGYAMLFGAIYFQDRIFFDIADKILNRELPEQILSDGAHFELCPMYHKLMLFRVLDCYNLLDNNYFLHPSVSSQKIINLKYLLANKAALMLGWLINMTYSDGSTPNFGDSTEGIAPISEELLKYAKRLNIKAINQPLSTSGYRKLKNNYFELTAKVGQIGPDYILGHAHADSLNFELRIEDEPLLIDTGISTYNKNARRQLERSTESHNTVEINRQNSSQVWGGFRVGKRAKTQILEENAHSITAEHNGYKKFNISHKRIFELEEKKLHILDFIGTNNGKAFFHFHPNHKIKIHGEKILFNKGQIQFSDIERIELQQYQSSQQYNFFLSGQKVIITFKKELKTTIECV